MDVVESDCADKCYYSASQGSMISKRHCKLSTVAANTLKVKSAERNK